MISQDLTSREQAELLSFLDKNNDVFAWRTSDLMGVSRDIIEHKLQVNPSPRPRKQRLHKIFDEKVVAMKVEVQRLMDAGFMREVDYPSWLANVIMVKKKNGMWRMCTDFTDLNKCCLKDDFPLTRIDKVVDSATGYKIMALLDYFLGYHQIWLRKEDEEKTCFITPFGTYCYLRMPEDKVVDSATWCKIMALLDYFSWYHQIWLHKEDEEKTSFVTPFGTYCYLRMPEGLKNAGPTFCRMTKAVLNEQMERNVFAYVDDIVVVSRKKKTQLQDLAETFTNMCRAQLKLNPKKCMFGVSRRKVLGFLVSVKGIEANPDKINAIVHMKPLGSRKDV
jgi:hypothetical protein